MCTILISVTQLILADKWTGSQDLGQGDHKTEDTVAWWGLAYVRSVTLQDKTVPQESSSYTDRSMCPPAPDRENMDQYVRRCP